MPAAFLSPVVTVAVPISALPAVPVVAVLAVFIGLAEVVAGGVAAVGTAGLAALAVVAPVVAAAGALPGCSVWEFSAKAGTVASAAATVIAVKVGNFMACVSFEVVGGTRPAPWSRRRRLRHIDAPGAAPAAGRFRRPDAARFRRLARRALNT